MKNRRVFVHVLAAFRYGREDLDVLGLSFRKDLFLASAQLYPPQQPFLDDLPTNPIPVIAVASCNSESKMKSTSTYEEENSPEPGSAPTDLKPLTRLQERLIKKLGPSAYPFYFEVRDFVSFEDFLDFNSLVKCFFIVWCRLLLNIFVFVVES